MAIFNVIGNTKYGQMVLQATTVRFEKNSKLILSPLESNMTPPTSLTIIADKIEIADRAEITYDLDGQPGIDADTPAVPPMGAGLNGSDGGSVPGEGSYPQASNGADGQHGKTGPKGTKGIHAPELEIFAGEISQNHSDAMTINFKGQDGSKGGKGGNGGKGGDGQKGAASQTSDSWYDGDECDREPGKGGNGGRGGDAGFPGRGGDGGNGGIVKVFVRKAFLPSVQTWIYIVKGGKGAVAGDPGNKGDGGKGGAQGKQNDPCPSRPEYHGSDGPPGLSMDDADPKWTNNFKGKDGFDGEANTYELTGVPN
jgi:hypothetical protein